MPHMCTQLVALSPGPFLATEKLEGGPGDEATQLVYVVLDHFY